VSENRVIRRIFGLKRDEVTGGWRTLHYEGMRDLCSLTNEIIKPRRMRLAGYVAHGRNASHIHNFGWEA
jgi:hypothetical protein